MARAAGALQVLRQVWGASTMSAGWSKPPKAGDEHDSVLCQTCIWTATGSWAHVAGRQHYEETGHHTTWVSHTEGWRR